MLKIAITQYSNVPIYIDRINSCCLMHSINQFFFVMEKYCVLYAVRTKLLNIIYVPGFKVLNSQIQKKSLYSMDTVVSTINTYRIKAVLTPYSSFIRS
jgi:hypothetical protein